jgi:hypothetical protein
MKLTERQRQLGSTAVEGILLVVFLAYGSYLWSKKHTTVTTKTVTVTNNAKATATPKAVASGVGAAADSVNETLSVPVDSLAAGYVLSVQAPKSWRTVDIRSLVYPGEYSSYALNDLGAILRFVPDYPERAATYPAIEPINRLDVIATSMKAKDDGAHKVRAQAVQSADGTLSGTTYLYMQTQSASYDPSVVIELTGTVAGKPVRVSGVFVLYDQMYADLAGGGADLSTRVLAARKALTDGNPPADTIALYDRVTAMVKSLKVTKK